MRNVSNEKLLCVLRQKQRCTDVQNSKSGARNQMISISRVFRGLNDVPILRKQQKFHETRNYLAQSAG